MNKHEQGRGRLLLISSLLVLLALLIIIRLFHLQILKGDHYSSSASDLYSSAPTDVYDRGAIYFSNKDNVEIAAATLKTGYILAISPKDVTDPEKVARAISGVVDISVDDFISKAARLDDPYEEIARRLSERQASQIEEFNFRGVQLYREQWRYYPGGSLAAHVLGFVGWDDDDYSGRYGIESIREDILNRNDDKLYVNFFAEIFGGVNKAFDRSASFAGNIILTIDSQVQNYVENQLNKVSKDWEAREAGAIVIRPASGEIIAMGKAPTFEPSNYGKATDISIFHNPLVEDIHEMGSIVKPLTVAMGLDLGVVRSSSTYDDKGYIEVDGKRIENYDGKGRGTVDMQEVLNQSLNTGVIFVARKIGKEKHKQYLEDFGLGIDTGIDLPNEVTGLLANLTRGRDVEYATAAFGQGIAVSPIAMTRALGALANGGLLMRPHVTKRIEYDLGYSDTTLPVDQGRVIKRSTSDEITRMLVNVVDEALLGGSVSLPSYSTAAKTGTAQIVDPDNGGYYDDRFLHTFFGYFPAYDPEFLIFLYIKEPVGARYASQTLTMPFINIEKFLINYYDIPPDR